VIDLLQTHQNLCEGHKTMAWLKVVKSKLVTSTKSNTWSS